MALRAHSTITLRSHHGKYLCVEDNHRVIADRNSAQTWESFTLGKNNGGEIYFGDRVHLKTYHGRYICAEPNQKLIGDRNAPAEWETFHLVDPYNKYGNGPVYANTQVALRSHHGYYVCAEPSGRVVADRSEIGEWERFTLNVVGGGYSPQPSYTQTTTYVSQPYVQPAPFVQTTPYPQPQVYPPQFSTPYVTQPTVVQTTFVQTQPNGGQTVYFGDRIKLKHVATGCVLHSHHYHYHTGSQQQQVTCIDYRNQDDYFEVQSPNGQQGPVPYGALVIFRHCATGQYLHSHNNHLSPVTQQQEVSCYGGRDSNDNWVITPVGFGGQTLTAGATVTITHVNTNNRLHSHPNKVHVYDNVFQQEVTCYHIPDHNDSWRVMEIQGRYYQE